MIVCKYGILMTLLWLKKIELLHIKYKSYFIKNVSQKYDKFMQLICKRLQNREKRGPAIEWVKSMKCDIAYFQETHFDQNIENEINFNTDVNVYGSIGTSASRGVAIFINKAVKKHISIRILKTK